MAELLTTLAKDRQGCEQMMANMGKMMEMMSGGKAAMPMTNTAK